MEKWFVAAKKADFEKWAADLGISPVLARIIRNRNVEDEEEARQFLYGTLEDCHSPFLLKDMEKAVNLLHEAMGQKKRIRVIGDYDVDGICASYILTRGLQWMGALADTAIPHRIHDGYGLNDSLIEEAQRDGIQVIVTCDNGIAAAPQIEKAREAGMLVIVTDHHEVPYREENGVRVEQLPPAHAVINPKQEQCTYPFSGICGGVVAYKLIQAMVSHMPDETRYNTQERETTEENLLAELLEMAALATVCDVMELKGENRIIVREGLAGMRRTQNHGLRALMEVNGIETDGLSAYHMGFVIGPCLNATGRLDTALRALELLESRDKAAAMSAAQELKALNDSRKNLTLQGVEQARHDIEENGMEQDKVLVVYLPQVHESLAGIIAGRLREQYHRPVFVLTKGEEGVKGSGRSIETYHMYEKMSEVKHFFSKYGGHKAAAGLSMEEQDIGAFRTELNSRCGLTEEDLIPRVHIDVPMPLDYADMRMAKELEKLEPFGVGNPKPLFAQKELRFISGAKMGAKKNCARYRVATPEGAVYQLVFFGDLDRFSAFLDEKYGAGSGTRLYREKVDFIVSVTYQLGINSFRGKEEAQYIMQNFC